MNEPDPEPPSLDKALNLAVATWRKQHGLREDDAVVLLVELFRIEQQYWDKQRRRDLPDLEPPQAAVTQLLAALCSHQHGSDTLATQISQLLAIRTAPTVTRVAACLAALAGILGGYLLGRFWP